jgi:hypothetical protein
VATRIDRGEKMMEEKITQWLYDYQEHLKVFSEKKAYRVYLEEYSKTIKSQQMKVAEKAGFKTAASQEREARLSEVYINHLELVRTVYEEELKAQFKMKAIEMEIELFRTQQASQRLDRKAHNF